MTRSSRSSRSALQSTDVYNVCADAWLQGQAAEDAGGDGRRGGRRAAATGTDRRAAQPRPRRTIRGAHPSSHKCSHAYDIHTWWLRKGIEGLGDMYLLTCWCVGGAIPLSLINLSGGLVGHAGVVRGELNQADGRDRQVHPAVPGCDLERIALGVQLKVPIRSTSQRDDVMCREQHSDLEDKADDLIDSYIPCRAPLRGRL